MTTVKRPLSMLVEDFSIYPRHAVDSSHVADLVRAIKGGNTPPLPLVQADTLRIVDGWHRIRAYRKVLGPAGAIDVEEREFADEKALVEAAIERNAAHGRKLDQLDRARSVLMLEKLGVETAEIAVTLHITPARVQELRVKVAVVGNGEGNGERRPVKAILQSADPDHLRRVTQQQYDIQRSSSGRRPAQEIRQLIREIEGEVIDLADPGLCSLLWSLHDAIEAKVPGAEQESA